MDITNRTISTILKHDSKVTSYKIALLRAINDVVLSFPDVRNFGLDVAIPLRMLAQFWLAYYWPFVDPSNPIMQGPRTRRGGKLRNDMAFRESLTAFRRLWEDRWPGASHPSDGFFIINELRLPRKRESYDIKLLKAYDKTLSKIAATIQMMPIRYAGSGEYTVFDKPERLDALSNVIAIPGTHPQDRCLVVKADLWLAFRELSLWVEALCIHEWSLFTERIEQPDETRIDRGVVYVLLTARPDSRRPLTWERNEIDLLLMEGKEFTCPWSERRIRQGVDYEVDHLIPIALYPINEMWNLVPSDPGFNNRKCDLLPSPQRLTRAQVHLEHTYELYAKHPPLNDALREDVAVRFADMGGGYFPADVAAATTNFILSVIETRNIKQF